MKQYEAVIQVMEENGGYATLGFLYQHVLKVPDVEWKTKTPFASIRRIVQDERFFFKIKPGLWALKTYKDNLPFDIYPQKQISKSEQEEFSHSYYQGLLIEIGNLKHFETFVSNQDKNKPFLGRKLSDMASIKKFYEFTYSKILDRARTIDVSWFNERKMPSHFYEVEHTADVQNSLLKFVELQDFNVHFCIVADEARKNYFEAKMSLSSFVPLRSRVQFMDYNKLSEWHSKTCEIASIENNLGFNV